MSLESRVKINLEFRIKIYSNKARKDIAYIQPGEKEMKDRKKGKKRYVIGDT